MSGEVPWCSIGRRLTRAIERQCLLGAESGAEIAGNAGGGIEAQTPRRVIGVGRERAGGAGAGTDAVVGAVMACRQAREEPCGQGSLGCREALQGGEQALTAEARGLGRWRGAWRARRLACRKRLSGEERASADPRLQQWLAHALDHAGGG